MRSVWTSKSRTEIKIHIDQATEDTEVRIKAKIRGEVGEIKGTIKGEGGEIKGMLRGEVCKVKGENKGLKREIQGKIEGLEGTYQNSCQICHTLPIAIMRKIIFY